MVGELVEGGDQRVTSSIPRSSGSSCTIPRDPGKYRRGVEGDDPRGAFGNQAGDLAHNIAAMNAGAAIYVSGLCKTFKDGIERARNAIASGEAKRKLDEFVQFTQKLKGA